MLTDRYCDGSQTPYTVRLRLAPATSPQHAPPLRPRKLRPQGRPRHGAGRCRLRRVGCSRAAPAAGGHALLEAAAERLVRRADRPDLRGALLQDALKHLPSDVQTYSSAHDDILRALQSAIAKQKNEHKNVSNNTLVPPQGGGGQRLGRRRLRRRVRRQRRRHDDDLDVDDADVDHRAARHEAANGGLAGTVGSATRPRPAAAARSSAASRCCWSRPAPAGLIAKRVQRAARRP